MDPAWEWINGPPPSLAELEDRAMAAYNPSRAGPGSAGIAVRLDGFVAIAIQERARSGLLESDAEGPEAARALLDWVLHGQEEAAPYPIRRQETRGHPDQVAVLHGERPLAAFPTTDRRESWLVFPGSFNPFHRGHARLAEVAHEMTGLPVDFELSIRNVDKPPLHFRAIAERIRGLLEHPGRSHFHGPAWLTSAPTFLEKARAFPGPVRFIVGMDTILRIGDPRYYRDAVDCARTLDELAGELQATFLAFPRNRGDGRLSGPEELSGLPPRLRAITEVVPADRVRDVLDISSSRIRAAASGTLPATPGPD
ncbi:MAG: hypothetical protein U0800_16840 [Isosphaeraceae bacterium]